MERDFIAEVMSIRAQLEGIHKDMAERYPDETAEINTAIQVLQNVTGDMRKADARSQAGLRALDRTKQHRGP